MRRSKQDKAHAVLLQGVHLPYTIKTKRKLNAVSRRLYAFFRKVGGVCRF